MTELKSLFGEGNNPDLIERDEAETSTPITAKLYSYIQLQIKYRGIDDTDSINGTTEGELSEFDDQEV